MKKLFMSLCFIMIVLLQGCNINPERYLNLKENKSKNYYFEEISKKFKNEESFKLEIFDNNFYKTYTVSDEYNHVITDFFNSLTAENFIDPIDKNSNNKIFEIIIKFDDAKYYITIINEDYIYLSPSDGYVKSDFINMSTVEEGLNLYKLCNYISEKSTPM